MRRSRTYPKKYGSRIRLYSFGSQGDVRAVRLPETRAGDGSRVQHRPEHDGAAPRARPGEMNGSSRTAPSSTRRAVRTRRGRASARASRSTSAPPPRSRRPGCRRTPGSGRSSGSDPSPRRRRASMARHASLSLPARSARARCRGLRTSCCVIVEPPSTTLLALMSVTAARDPLDVDAAVRVEAPILDPDHRLPHPGRHVLAATGWRFRSAGIDPSSEPSAAYTNVFRPIATGSSESRSQDEPYANTAAEPPIAPATIAPITRNATSAPFRRPPADALRAGAVRAGRASPDRAVLAASRAHELMLARSGRLSAA